MSGLALAALLFVGLAKSRSNQSGASAALPACCSVACATYFATLRGRQLTRSGFAASAKRIFAVMMLILAYSLCSSMLLILNKVRAQLLRGRALAPVQERSLCPTRDSSPLLGTVLVTPAPARALTLDTQVLQKAHKGAGCNDDCNQRSAGGGRQVAVTYVPAPSFILALQLLSCAGFVRTLSAAGVVDAEPITLRKARPFAVIVFGFIGTLYSNITALKVRSTTRRPMPINSLPKSTRSSVAVCIRVIDGVHVVVAHCAHASSAVPALCTGLLCWRSRWGAAGPKPNLLGCRRQYVPVDTIICFRASMPLIIAVIEWMYMDRELPSARSWASMLSAAPAPGARLAEPARPRP
jgi:hypothetical protein